MRFATRVDWWLAILLAAVALVSCVPMPVARLLGHEGPPLWLALLPAVVWAVILSFLLPQWYELRDDGIFIRQGLRKVWIVYPSLLEAQRFDNMTSSGAVFSKRRILLVTESGSRYIIAVAEEERFMNELARRCSRLQARPFGLGLPFSTPSYV